MRAANKMITSIFSKIQLCGITYHVISSIKIFSISLVSIDKPTLLMDFQFRFISFYQ